jgi:hypothetical protein
MAVLPDLDMSQLPVAHRCDIMVSELLGSLADNEFAPEISIPAAQALLRPPPAKTVTIPATWTAFGAPVCCPAAHRICSGKAEGLESFYMLSLIEENYY